MRDLGELLRHLGFNEDWRRLGLLSNEQLSVLEEALNDFASDPHPEHYRWRIFARFLGTHEALPAELAIELYELGMNDGDAATGRSMMAAVLRRRDCPPELVRRARRAQESHLQRLAFAHRLPEDRYPESGKASSHG